MYFLGLYDKINGIVDRSQKEVASLKGALDFFIIPTAKKNMSLR